MVQGIPEHADVLDMRNARLFTWKPQMKQLSAAAYVLLLIE
jgi:hypothetical protein